MVRSRLFSIAALAVLSTQAGALAGEVLYNGIELPNRWPPRVDKFVLPMPVPYLRTPPKVLPIDVGRQLFVDDFLVEHTTLKRTFHQAEYHPASPVLAPDKRGNAPEGPQITGPVAMPFSDGIWFDPFSRDGFHWHRPDRKPFAGVNEKPGAWNWGNVQSAGGGCLVVGDKLYFYVSGRALPTDPTWKGACSTGLAVIRRDGFASMDADGHEGALTTRTLTFRGGHLFVNLAAPAGELRVEVLDSHGRPLEPFTRINCLAVTGDKTLLPMRWTGAADLSALAGKPVRFRFHLTRGSLYAFWVSPAMSGASHGYVAAGGPGFTGPIDTVGSAIYKQSDAGSR